MLKAAALASLVLSLHACSYSQHQKPADTRLLGGPCEGCEAIFEWGTKNIRAVDTLPDFRDNGVKIKISGTVYNPDGKTPAPGVIIYVYHTNQEGIYPAPQNATGWAARHGAIRGWVKTDGSGRYAFYTLKPGVYPNRGAPAHIHLTVLEPDGSYYYLADYYFEGDTLLTNREMFPEKPRGGNSGVVRLQQDGDLLVGNRDLVLRKNVESD